MMHPLSALSLAVVTLLCVLPSEIMCLKWCPAGSYQADNLIDTCVKCPIGTFKPVDGVFGCIECTKGAYCSEIGTLEPQSCPDGTYQPNKGATSADACIICPRGTYKLFSGSQCHSCPTGRYCSEAGASTPHFCPPGTFQPKLNATSIDACLKCPIGTYQPYPGASTCKTCPQGFTCIDPAKTPIFLSLQINKIRSFY